MCGSESCDKKAKTPCEQAALESKKPCTDCKKSTYSKVKRKRKANNYSLWVKMECQSNPAVKGLRGAARFKKCGQIWRSMTDDEKRQIKSNNM